MNFDSLLSDIIATVIGGSILTLLLFIAKEWLFPIPNISGQWHFETHTVGTAYKPFSGMILRYVAMIWQEGTVIHGSVEKIYEHSSTGERSYVGKNRTRGTLEGRIEKLYLSKDRVSMHLLEDGIQRSSTVVLNLVQESVSEMSGSFYSTAADQSGTVKWERMSDTDIQSIEQVEEAGSS